MEQMDHFEIAFEGVDAAEALRLANELEEELRVIPAEVRRVKARPETMDFGSTLVLVFGTPVAITLAKALSNFLQRHSGASIAISRDGAIVATNLDSRDASRIAEAFKAAKRS